MEIGIIYAIIIIISTLLGAISGMSGGVIMRPVFDTVGYHDVASMTFYASVAVIVMSLVSTWKRFKKGMDIQLGLAIFVSVGSIVGGMLGNVKLEWLLGMFQENTVNLVQITLSVITLLFALLYSFGIFKSYKVNNMFLVFLTGIVLGGMASLLGIGGGPINVAAFMLLFGMSMKDAAGYSIITIFFAQASRLVTTTFTSGFGAFDLAILAWILPAAAIGGLLGALFGVRLSEKSVRLVFKMVLVGVISLNVYNGIMLFV
ncbi:MAG: sulfite exporter TauE/SafE family protein [Turicibacter sp.]|nr:sulfite exporter TauE/SafE family protein [Turicibacter sp.]